MDSWEKVRISSGLIAAVFVPLVVAVLGNNYTQAIKEREVQGQFVGLAVEILRQKPTEDTLNLRKWATMVIDRYSGVPLGESTQRELIQNLRIIQSSKFEDTGFREAGGRKIEEIIILDTQSDNIESEIKGLKNFGVAYHYLIDSSGEVRLLVDESNVAFHTAGRNTNSIGIGLLHITGKPYPDNQISSLVSLLAEIVTRHEISIDSIFASSQVSSKKSDIPDILNQIRERVKLQMGTK